LCLFAPSISVAFHVVELITKKLNLTTVSLVQQWCFTLGFRSFTLNMF